MHSRTVGRSRRWIGLVGLVLVVGLLLVACGGAPAADVPAGADVAASEGSAEGGDPAAEGAAEGGEAAEGAAEGGEAAAEGAAEGGEAAGEAAGAAAGAAIAGVHTYIIVPEESEARYLATEEFFADALEKYGINAGFGDAVGVTQAIEGQLTLDFDDLSNALGENGFTVQMNTFVTGRRTRDNWIRTDGPRFNDYPEATFVATAIDGAPASYAEGEEVSFQLTGDLTIREVTRPTTFDVTARLEGNTLTGTAGTRILLTDFEIEPPSFINTLTVDNEVGLEVDFTAREP